MIENEKQARDQRDTTISTISEMQNSGDSMGVQEILNECGKYEFDWYQSRIAIPAEYQQAS